MSFIRSMSIRYDQVLFCLFAISRLQQNADVSEVAFYAFPRNYAASFSTSFVLDASRTKWRRFIQQNVIHLHRSTMGYRLLSRAIVSCRLARRASGCVYFCSSTLPTSLLCRITVHDRIIVLFLHYLL